jgi:hypothetical protein
MWDNVAGERKGFGVWIGQTQHARTIHDAHQHMRSCVCFSVRTRDVAWRIGGLSFLGLEANLAMRPCTPLWSMPADV